MIANMLNYSTTNGIDYKLLFQRSNDGIIIYDVQQDVAVAANQKALNLLDRTEEEVIGHAHYSYLFNKHSDDEFSTDNLTNVVEIINKKRQASYKRPHFKSDGSKIWLRVHFYLMPEPKENLLVVVYRDITKYVAQQELIQEQNNNLQKQNEQLQQYIESNKDLENLAYVAANELKSPLKTIVGFSDLLSQYLKGEKYDAIPECNEFINNSAKEMQELVNKLMEYSKMDTQIFSPQKMSISQLLDKVLERLEEPITRTNAQIQLKELPTYIFADWTRINNLFSNLISNSLKYQTLESTPQIEIGGEQHEDYWQFYVKDNGVGIEEKQYSSIFLPFRSLHTNNLKGPGLGLTFCKKIVEQHNGNIWVESTPNEGSTFYFSIPS